MQSSDGVTIVWRAAECVSDGAPNKGTQPTLGITTLALRDKVMRQFTKEIQTFTLRLHMLLDLVRKSTICLELSDPNRSDFESQIASDCNRNSKSHCDSENACKTAISLRFLWEKLATSELQLEIASDL